MVFPFISGEYILATARRSRLSNHKSKALIPLRVLRLWPRKSATFLAYPRRSPGPYYKPCLVPLLDYILSLTRVWITFLAMEYSVVEC